MMRRAFVFVLICLVLLVGGPAYAAAPNDPGWTTQWHLRTIHVDTAWARTKGSGVIVAVVDTGVDLGHPDLRGRIVSGIDLVDGGSPDDEQGHGTFMAGIIAANVGNNLGVASVAPLAKIMPVRVLNENGTGEPKKVAEGIRWAADHGADVINLSLAQEPLGGAVVPGNLFGDPAIDQAIEYAATQRRAFVVAAAGNEFGSGGDSRTSYDATVGGVLVVGASTRTDRRAAYSNYGSGLDVLAPGGGSSSSPSDAACQSNSPVVSTWWDGSSKYGQGCGTSMAVAHVSGIGALLMARGSSNTTAANRIKNTAKDLYSSGWDANSGWGRVDAAAAVGSSGTSAKPKPKSSSRPAVRRSVGAAAKPPAVQGAKVTKPPAVPTPSPVRGVALASAVPYQEPSDPKLYLIALALALSVGVGVGHASARRARWANR
jgi:serine protease